MSEEHKEKLRIAYKKRKENGDAKPKEKKQSVEYLLKLRMKNMRAEYLARQSAGILSES